MLAENSSKRMHGRVAKRQPTVLGFQTWNRIMHTTTALAYTYKRIDPRTRLYDASEARNLNDSCWTLA